MASLSIQGNLTRCYRYHFGMTDRVAEETSEGAVEDRANQKNLKLAQKQYKIKRPVTV
jgi:hypothetical protein